MSPGREGPSTDTPASVSVVALLSSELEFHRSCGPVSNPPPHPVVSDHFSGFSPDSAEEFDGLVGPGLGDGGISSSGLIDHSFQRVPHQLSMPPSPLQNASPRLRMGTKSRLEHPVARVVSLRRRRGGISARESPTRIRKALVGRRALAERWSTRIQLARRRRRGRRGWGGVRP